MATAPGHVPRVAVQHPRTAFPDTVHTVEDQIAEGDKVVTRLRARATFTGELSFVGRASRRS